METVVAGPRPRRARRAWVVVAVPNPWRTYQWAKGPLYFWAVLVSVDSLRITLGRGQVGTGSAAVAGARPREQHGRCRENPGDRRACGWDLRRRAGGSGAEGRR